MTYPITWIAVFALCASPSLACEERAVFTTTNSSGVKTSLYLSPDNFLGSPSWDASAGAPPLGVGSAISTALDWAERENPKYDGVEFDELSLLSYQCRSGSTYWFYLIDYTPTFDGNEVHGARSWVAVLFDGSIIGPQPHRE